MTPVLSAVARRLKVRYFFSEADKRSRILEIGCGDGWLASSLRNLGFSDVSGIDLRPPADVAGDVRDWKALGLRPGSFDAIVAFEVLEHVDCLDACFDLLKPTGRLLATTPAPAWDWLCLLLERVGLSQRRTSPHCNLIDLRSLARFSPVAYRRVALISQWAILEKRGQDARRTARSAA